MSEWRELLDTIPDKHLRKQVKEALFQEHKKFLAFLEEMEELVFIGVKGSGDVLFINSAWKNHFGNNPPLKNEQISHSFRNPWTPNEITHSPCEWETLNKVDNCWYKCREFPFLWPDGKRAQVLIVKDITETKRLTIDLKHHQESHEKIVFGTVQAMGKMVEMRDPYTAGHQKRVAQLASFITREMGLDEEEIDCLYLASLVHDIGKIYIPTEILLKPTPLSEIEYKMIQSHPVVSYEILKSIDFPWPIAKIVRQHHERLDGSGYPDGLRDDRILPQARIMAVADVVEAMLSQRSYRSERGYQEVMEEISKNREKLYDPKVVDACLKTIIEKKITSLGFG